MIFSFKISLSFVLIGALFCGCNSDKQTAGLRVNVLSPVESLGSQIAVKLPRMVKRTWVGADSSNGQAINYFFKSSETKLKKDWAFDLGVKRIINTPIIKGSKIIFLSNDGQLKCADLNTKKIIWEHSVLPEEESELVLHGGGIAYDDDQNIYVTTSVGEILSISVKIGKLNWRYKVNSPIMAAPTIVENDIFVTDTENISWSISSAGKLNWSLEGISHNQIGAQTGRITIANDVILLPLSTGVLTAVDRFTGVKKWDYAFNLSRSGYSQNAFGAFNGEPKVYQNKIYFGSLNGQFNAFTIGGDVIWQVPIGLRGSPLVISDSLFFVSDTEDLTRLSRRDGSLIWSKKLGKGTNLTKHFSPILIGSKIWVANSSGMLISFDPLTGSLIDKIEISSGFSGSPIYFSEKIILHTTQGNLLAFR